MYKIITEGETRFYVPVAGSFGKRGSGRDKKPPVFYNPHMRLNRDFSVLFMKIKGRGLVFADALAGSGAKGLRISVESGNPVFLNDANESAVDLIKKNAELNCKTPMISNLDANAFLLENKRVFDFIDIDPFGSPVPFIDSALLSLKKHGWVGVTATDTAALCGVYSDTCYRRYQATPLRSAICHEIGLRILIGYVARTAAKYDRGIGPVLSHSTRHYFRAYIEVGGGVVAAKKSLNSLGYLYSCPTCNDFLFENGAFSSEKFCGCGVKMKVAGPLWLGNLHESAAVKKMFAQAADHDSIKLLTVLSEELDQPFYHDVHAVAKNLKINPAKIDVVIARLMDKGFKVTRTHFSPLGIKTTAPVEEVKKALIP